MHSQRVPILLTDARITKFLALNVYWDTSSLQTPSGTHIYGPLLRMLKQWLVSWTASESTWLLPGFIFARVSLDQNGILLTYLGLSCPVRILSRRYRVRICLCGLVGGRDSLIYTLHHLFHKRNVTILSLLYHYFYGKR